MDALPPPTDWDDLARKSDIQLLQGQITGLDGRLTRVEGRLTDVEVGLREMQSGLLTLTATVIEMKGAIDAQVPKFLRANILTAFAASGVVLAAVKL